MPPKQALLTTAHSELKKFMADNSFPEFHAEQVREWVFKRNALAFEDMTNIPKDLRILLNRKFYVHNTNIEKTETDGKGATKFLLKLYDNRMIEAVVLEKEGRITFCLSSQVGCALNCSFCATAKMGFSRNLSTEEILAQFILLRAHTKKVNSVVFMGMGEPLQNYNNLLIALNILNGFKGFNLGSRHITISTAGIIEGIEKLSAIKRDFRLAISLHSMRDSVRSQIMPINRKYPLKKLLQVTKDYSKKGGRRVTFEWVLIDGVNDTPSEAHRLVELSKEFAFKVNLIPYNPTNGNDYKASNKNTIRTFKRILIEGGVEVIERYRQGQGANAGCGQLFVSKETSKEE